MGYQMKKRRISWQVIKENWSFIAEDIFLAVFIGFFFVGIVSLFSSGESLSVSVKDVTPLFIGLVSVYVAFSVLSMSLEANRKQAKIERGLSVRPIIQIERFTVHNNWGKLTNVILKFSKDENGLYDAAFDDAVKFNNKPIVLYNSGLGPCYSVVVVTFIDGKLMQGVNLVNEIGEKERKPVNLIYTNWVERSDFIYTVCKDIYESRHVVAHYFTSGKNDIEFIFNRYVGNDNDGEGSEEAKEVIDFVKNEGMFFVE